MSSPRIRRLESDFQRVKTRFSRWPLVRIESAEGSPPEKYRIIYNIRGIFTTPDGRIMGQDKHILEISLGLEYPRRPPQCRLLTPIFHPNFNETEVCAQDIYAASEGLDDLIVRIGRMIAYQFYNTKSPLNGLAAKWVTENSTRFPVDKREISPPLVDAGAPSKPLPQPRILSVESTPKRKEIDTPKSNYSVMINSGIELIKTEKYDAALQIFNSIINDVEHIKHAYYFRAIIESKVGDSSSAIADLTLAATLGHKKAQEILDKMKIQYQ